MSGETVITVVGNLTADPELRFTPSGSAVANFTIASTPRTFDKQSNEWKDGETLFMRANIWREAAENVAESLTKGMRVIANGFLKSRTFETKEGEKRTVQELEAIEIGPSLKYASAQVNRKQSNGGGQPGGDGNYGGFGGQQAAPANQGWGGQQQAAPQNQGWNPQPGAQNPNAQGWGNQPPAQPQGQQPPAQPQQQPDPWAAPTQQQPGPYGGPQQGQQPQQGADWNNQGQYAEPPF